MNKLPTYGHTKKTIRIEGGKMVDNNNLQNYDKLGDKTALNHMGILRGPYRGVSGTVHEPIKKRITVHGHKNSFSRITKIRKQDILSNDLCLH